MKTAIQELIEQLEKTIPEVKNGNVIDKAFWLEKEKQQIIEACKHGANYENSPYRNAEEYYNEEYGDIQK